MSLSSSNDTPNIIMIDNTDKEKKKVTILEKEMLKDYSYPDQDDEDIQSKLFLKNEFYSNVIPPRPDINDYEKVKNYRDEICGKPPKMREHQETARNLINPQTPYKGMLLFHGLGTGKTCVGAIIAEGFKDQVLKYNTKVYILVPGPILKDSWKQHLVKCSDNKQLNFDDKAVYVNSIERAKLLKNAINSTQRYVKIMSYKGFYKRVLGEKVIDKKIIKGSTVKLLYKKNDEGEFARDISIDRIYNLNNSIILIDEAHNLTGNMYGEALLNIIKNSVNLRVVLLTATPMKNLADDIVELLNFIRPTDSPIERDKIFSAHKNHLMEIKEGGIEYFKNMARGYVSYIRGEDSLVFALRDIKGEVPDELLFTKVIRCKMLEFQRQAYDITISTYDDTLDRKSEAVANFVLPGLSLNKKQIVGYYGLDGINLVKNQLKINGDLINNKIKSDFFHNKLDKEFIYATQGGRMLTGEIFKMPYLKYFSIKFYKALKKLNRLVWGKKGVRTAFVYSNLVKVGIEIFKEILLQNGYLEYQEDYANYQIEKTTICYFCGKTYQEHKKAGGYTTPKDKYTNKDAKKNINEDIDVDADVDADIDVDEDIDNTLNGTSSEYNTNTKLDIDMSKVEKSASSSNAEPRTDSMPAHIFQPATFLYVTGKSSEDNASAIPEEKKRLLDKIFNVNENKDGRFIKFVLGSKVMNVGVSLSNVAEVHILDVYYNLNSTEQVVGRAIRFCSHYQLMNIDNKFPVVKVYKYVIALGKNSSDGLSTEEELYHKAEQKYMLTKKIERAMKEVAVDCPLNFNGNIFEEETSKYENCKDVSKDKSKNKNDMCPVECDFTSCRFQCDDPKLNAEYYDPHRKLYKNLKKGQIDMSTFTGNLVKSKIDDVKSKIKELFITKAFFNLNDILNYVKDSLDEQKKETFDDFFVYRALDSLMPVTENDFNNFKDVIINKNYQQGYLIYRDNNYIFQPFDQNENVPLYYRLNIDQQNNNKLSLYSYLKNVIKITDNNNMMAMEQNYKYSFDDVMDYYDNREEFSYVGIIDSEIVKSDNNNVNVKDIFKIRNKRSKILEKKRATGIPSLKGSVCWNSKSKEEIMDICKKLDITINKKGTFIRQALCDIIKEKMLFLEKYATTANKNKLTYVMVPSNHPTYQFPYNLEDRVDYFKEQIKKNIKYKLNFSVEKNNKKENLIYKLIIKSEQKLDEYNDYFVKLGAIKNKNEYVINME